MPKTITLLLADSDAFFCARAAEELCSPDFSLTAVRDAREAVAAAERSRWDVCIIDQALADAAGADTVARIRESSGNPEVILLAAHATVTAAVAAMRRGAYDYIEKPVTVRNLRAVIESAAAKREGDLLQCRRRSDRRGAVSRAAGGDIVGNSRAIAEVLHLIDRVAKTDSPVLITGESGAGKELVAKAIHRNSLRDKNPFIVIDCAALSENLLENELFGHEEGAYTDAASRKRGLFEIADTGTLFIDEIGEMKLSTQAKLLRVTETQQFRRLGANQQIEVDVRLIAATNRDLAAEVDAGNFRKDLFYRLNVFQIHVPPLRERKEDIPLLVEHFLARRGGGRQVSSEALGVLMAYHWPGNIRELANVIERATVIARDRVITPADLPMGLVTVKPYYPETGRDKGLQELCDEFEKSIIAQTLQLCGGKRKKAAETLKLTRTKFYRKLGKHKMD